MFFFEILKNSNFVLNIFRDSILACGIHYQYHHKSDHQVYSVAQFKRESNFKIGKTHSCPECHLKFDKMNELSSHLMRTKHFPQSSSKNEINLFECQFDICQFKSTDFYLFKKHIIGSHSFYFDGPWSYDKNQEPKVNVKVRTFSAPSNYLHFPRIDCNKFADNKNEIEAIEDLLALYKGHSDEAYNLIYLQLNARRYKLEERKSLLNFH